MPKDKSFFKDWDEAISSIPLKDKEKTTCPYCKQVSAIQSGIEHDGNSMYQSYTCIKCNREFSELYEYKMTVDEKGEVIKNEQ